MHNKNQRKCQYHNAREYKLESIQSTLGKK